MIKPLSDVSSKDLDSAGIKAAYLGELLSKGFNVPNGFVITTDTKVLDEDKILDSFDRLSSDFVAVRSSPAPDRTDRPQCLAELKTDVWVQRHFILKAIHACRESVYSRHVRYYMQRVGIKQIPLAILVQHMMDATSSGVIFTQCPKEVDRMEIRACFGAGNAVTSGKTTHDTYVLDKDTDKIKERTISTQKVMSTRAGWTQMSPSDWSKPKLSQEQIDEVIALSKRVEDYFGRPQDIEFCFNGHGLWILQARPIIC